MVENENYAVIRNDDKEAKYLDYRDGSVSSCDVLTDWVESSYGNIFVTLDDKDLYVWDNGKVKPIMPTATFQVE